MSGDEREDTGLAASSCSMPADTVAEYVQRAQAAYENNDSKTVAELCGKILELDPKNTTAWELRAKFGGWDSKLYDFDIDFILNSAKRAIGLAPESYRSNLAADIYTARKKQIAARLEAAMMMPSYTSAKQIHGVMEDWQRLLVEIPCLNANLIESEITLCENLCLRSKLGVMPNDRVVYTAYATFNNKKSYGESFRKALTPRLEAEQARKCATIEAACKQAYALKVDYQNQMAAGLAPAEERKLLEQMRCSLQELIDTIGDASEKKLYEQQIEELAKQLEAIKPYKFAKRREVTNQLADLQEKLDEVDEQLKNDIAPVQAELDFVQARLVSTV